EGVGVRTSPASTNHVAVVLGPPAKAIGAADALSEIPRGIRKRIAARRCEASRSSSISVIMLPLAERCGKVMGDALSTLETPRAGPSEAAERSDRAQNPGESLSESPGTGFLMRLIRL